MKAPSFLLRLTVAGLTVWAPLAVAQTPPITLAVQLYVGLSITGLVGRVYHIDYTTNLGPLTAWTALDYLKLPSSPYLYIDTRVSTAGRRFYRARETAVIPVTNMVFIPSGMFTMGSPLSEAGRDPFGIGETQHSVTLMHSFWMMRFEVTQGEYLDLMGTTTAFHYGMALVEGMANFNSRDPYLPLYPLYCFSTWLGRTTSVGSYEPNAFELYDMHGNVFEWCYDWRDHDVGLAVTDPIGPETGVARVIRGGCWHCNGSSCRSAIRFGSEPGLRLADIGFRVVLSPGQ